MRTMYWGVYNWNEKTWERMGIKRRRWANADQAAGFITQYGRELGLSPRPFYVTRRTPEKMTPEAKAVIEAARVYHEHTAKFDPNDAKEQDLYHNVEMAFQRYDEATK